MRAWLLTANPKRQGLGRIMTADDLERYARTVMSWDNWSVRSTKIRENDSFFLMLLGQGRLNGIMARGSICSAPYKGESWDEEGEALYVNVNFDSHPHFLSQKLLRERFPDQLWSPQSSGISIRAKYLKDLDSLYKEEGLGYS